MNKLFKKALVIASALLSVVGTAKADKGMWLLNELTQENLQQMKELGFTLSLEQLYSLNKESVASSVVIFGRGCTGVTVSATGLIMTNHHCGYSAIQSQSTVDHDYLRDGFVSQTHAQELPIEGLQVRYLVDIKDVTPQLLARVKKAKSEAARTLAIEEAIKTMVQSENKRLKDEFKEVLIRPYYAGNKYYMLTYDVINDVRMVFAPPSSIGKYGGDTDNWMWTRHTGDFAVFRAYASKDNKPARYSADNQPYRPKSFSPVSTKGYQEGDYAMTIGFPGSTERYIPSWGIENRMDNQNQPMIEVRGAKQAIWRKAMDADQATRIKYSDKYASSSNYWKNSIGMNRGLRRLGVVERKRAEEAAFAQWANGRPEYANVLPELKTAYEASGSIMRRLYYLNETLVRGSELVALVRAQRASVLNPSSLDDFYKDYAPELDREVLPAMLEIANKELNADDKRALLAEVKAHGGSLEAYAKYLFDNSPLPYAEKYRQVVAQGKFKAEADPIVRFADLVLARFAEIRTELEQYSYAIQRGNRLYFAGRQQMDPKRPMPSDANFTMRLSYGSILGYSPSDGVQYNYFTTPKGILEKYQPGSTEFDLKPEFVDLLQRKSWGRWADKDGDLHVNFLSNNDITGGNSGSPVFNGKGEVIGLAFDGNWEAMSGDIEFEPALQRTISVDIRYVLFVIEQWGKCPRLVEELELR